MIPDEPAPNPNDDQWFLNVYDERHRERQLEDDPESLGAKDQARYFRKLKEHFEERELDQLAIPDLEPFMINWHGLKREVVGGLAELIESSEGERAVAAYVKKHPGLLVQHLSGGHGRYVIPGVELGAEHVVDFMIAERSSVGFEWYAVEFESVGVQMFNKSGDPSAALTHAIRQIGDWRTWLGQNLGYAERPRSAGGLGLRDIDPEVAGLVVLGRQTKASESVRARRRRLAGQNRIALRSFDWLLERAFGGIGSGKFPMAPDTRARSRIP